MHLVDLPVNLRYNVYIKGKGVYSMIVHIKVGVAKENGKWVAHWQQKEESEFNEILANRREELERKLDKALRLAYPKANYIVQHRNALADYA
jgi:hypothetical protein